MLPVTCMDGTVSSDNVEQITLDLVLCRPLLPLFVSRVTYTCFIF